MTTDRDLGRALNLWLAEGSNEVSDRVLDVVVERIALQRQRPDWRLNWRRPMPPSVKSLAAVAAVIAIAVVAWNLLPGPVPGPGSSSTPSPSPATSLAPAPSTASLPPWVGGVELTAGAVTSGVLEPALTYTIPSGWANFRDFVYYYAIFPNTPGNRTAVAGGDPAHSIGVATGDPAVPVANEDCLGTGQEGVGTTAAEVVAALAARDGLMTSAPKAVSISGLSGQQLDISLSPGWTGTCPGDATPAVPLVGVPLPAILVGDGLTRLIILDTPDEGSFVILVSVDHAADFESFAAVAMPIVESFEFDLTP